MLQRRKVAQPPNDLDAVFITRNGTWHYPTNVQGRLRHIRLLDHYADVTVLQGVTPHSFRRTVATEIDEVYHAEAAMNQLSHTSKTVTERHLPSTGADCRKRPQQATRLPTLPGPSTHCPTTSSHAWVMPTGLVPENGP